MKPHKHRPETEAVRGGTDLTRKTGRSPRPSIRPRPSRSPTTSSRCAPPAPTSFTRATAIRPTPWPKRPSPNWKAPTPRCCSRPGMDAITTSIFAAAEERRPHRGAARHLRRRDEVSSAHGCRKLGHRNHVCRHQRLRAARSRHPAQHEDCSIWSRRPTRRCGSSTWRRWPRLAKQHGLITLIDSTFATPINQRPADFGIDLVMHSGTKYFGGHSDLICGIVAGRRDLIEKIHETRTTLGGTMDPHAAWLLLRGIKTLAVRVQRQNESALRVAQFLARHPKVRRVNYPFLEGHPAARAWRWNRCAAAAACSASKWTAPAKTPAACSRGAASVHAGAEPGRRGFPGQHSGADVARHDLGRAAAEDGHHRATDPALGGNRERGRPDRRPGAGADGGLAPQHGSRWVFGETRLRHSRMLRLPKLKRNPGSLGARPSTRALASRHISL